MGVVSVALLLGRSPFFTTSNNVIEFKQKKGYYFAFKISFKLNFIQLQVALCQVDNVFTSGISQAIVAKGIWKDFSRAMAGFVKS